LKKNEINSFEIARLAGVSRSTVSRVINRYPNVPAQTREKVMRVIEQYNYFPNMSGQVLAGKNTRTIGLFLIDSGKVSDDQISNFLLANVIETASTQGYYVLTMIVRDCQDPEAVRSVKESFYQRRIDGGIFIGATNSEPLIEELIAEGFKIGLMDYRLPGTNDPNRIVYNFDNMRGMEMAINYLTSLGHRNIGIIQGDLHRYSGASRYFGFIEAMQKHELTVRQEWVISGEFTEDSGRRAIRSLLSSGHELPTAILAANDSVAFGAIQSLYENGIRVPEHISIVGFDNHSMSSRFQPALTTVHVDFAKVMSGLTSMLIQYVEQGTIDIYERVAKTYLVVRDSCRRLDR